MKRMLLVCCVILIAGCSTHYTSKDALIEQIKGQEAATPIRILALIAATYRYGAVVEVYCVNDKGKKFVVPVDNNSMLIVRNKQGETFKFYLDTAYVDKDMIRGLRSRILSIKNEVPLADIETIQIYSEFSASDPFRPWNSLFEQGS